MKRQEPMQELAFNVEPSTIPREKSHNSLRLVERDKIQYRNREDPTMRDGLILSIPYRMEKADGRQVGIYSKARMCGCIAQTGLIL